MATYTCTLSQNYTSLATYYAATLTYSTSTLSYSPRTISPPRWNSGRKAFKRYYNATMGIIVGADGDTYGLVRPSGDFTATEEWDTLAPALTVYSNGSALRELVFDGGVWYSDYANRIALDAEHPMPVPTRECYRFLGCYSTNSGNGTKYINADGTPTQDFPSSISSDAAIYARWELVSVKITISASYGSWQFKTFYQSKTTDANGKYGYYTDSTCPESSRIYGIPVPMRELYAWGGLRSSSSSSSTLYANVDGTFTGDFIDRPAAAANVNGNFWTQVSYKITVNTRGGSAATLAYYVKKTDGGVYADWLCETTQLSSLPVPSLQGSRFLGYFSVASGGTPYVDYDGTIQPDLASRAAATTINAQWRTASYTVTLSGLSGDYGSIYYDATAAKFFDASSATITSVTPPTDTGNAFQGYYTEANGGGEQAIDSTGAISQSFAPTSNTTLIAYFTIGKCAISVDADEGTGGTAEFFYDVVNAKFYADTDLTDEITSVTLPTLRLFDTLGLYTASEGGTQIVDSAGNISSSFAPTEAQVVVCARYDRRCYETVIDPGDGSSETAAIYRAPNGSTWYADDALTEAVTNVGIPIRSGYAFGGYGYGGTSVIDTTGDILSAAALDEDYVALASWTARQYTLTFDPAGGSASFFSKLVTFGVAVGQLPTASRPNRRFEGWVVDGVPISQSDVWSYATDKTAVAAWRDNFGGLDDWFGLQGSLLMLVGSESGENRRVVNLWNGAIEAGGRLKNPVCTYRIKAAGDVTITLGSASRINRFMIVEFEYRTGADKEPLLVVKGVANEGADAISTYRVTLHVDPDHVAQDPFSAVSGGGELIAMTSGAKCDPVVPYENNIPCASDVVHGRLFVSGRTADYFGDGAPSLRDNFIDIGVPNVGSDVDFTTYSFAGEEVI